MAMTMTVAMTVAMTVDSRQWTVAVTVDSAVVNKKSDKNLRDTDSVFLLPISCFPISCFPVSRFLRLICVKNCCVLKNSCAS